jgi:dTDP-4-dehydrorhamnose reductase
MTVQMWGGLECTVARVGDAYVDQTLLNGHQRRSADLELFASLGIKRIRYPLIWERVAPDGLGSADWRWTDERLARLRDLGLRPILGLVHHGSGPRSTSLDDPSFAPGLAAFAERVADRYPWADAYTPVNEPLTTARFSGLYGFWYPHRRDQRSFLRMLINQTRATQLAMAAIRRINPGAELIQTEDLGKVHGTPSMAGIAALHNERRWLSLDLLIGMVGETHPFWQFFCEAGLAGAVEKIATEPCPPDVIGFNHYPASERFLDHRCELYPAWRRDTGGPRPYVDVEAMRILTEGPAGLETLLLEAWERFHLPMAITEAHNGSTRDEQLRWLCEFWDVAGRLERSGVDVTAVTVWALLGSYDWDRMLTDCVGYYEPGPFDVRGPRPRATAIASMVRDFASGRDFDHPVLDVPGVWHRSDRFAWKPEQGSPDAVPYRAPTVRTARSPRRLLVVGRNGTLGQAFAKTCALRALPFEALSRLEIDIVSRQSVTDARARVAPWAVINAAGYVRVDDAEADDVRCRLVNAKGSENLAVACNEMGIPLVSFSSDLVFNGSKRDPYVESDAVDPQNVYGVSKVEAERAIAKSHEKALVLRTSAFMGPWDHSNFISIALNALAAGRRFAAASDVVISPTYVPHLVTTVLDLLIDGESGIWHLANAGAVSWAELAREAARRARLDLRLIDAVPASEMRWTALRPCYSVLGSERGSLMPGLDAALDAFFACRESHAPSVVA